MRDNIYIKALKLGFEMNSGISFNDLVQKLKIDFHNDDQKANFIIWFYSNFYNELGEREITGHFNAPSSGYKIQSRLDRFESINTKSAHIKGEALNKYMDYLELERTRKSSRNASWFSIIAIIIAALGLIIPQKCENKPNSEDVALLDPAQNTFQTIIGEVNSEMLTYLVTDFEEQFLNKQFPNDQIDKAYEKFLIGIRDEKTNEWKLISDNSRKLFNESNLRFQIYSYVDSVWIEKDTANLTIKNQMPMVKRKYKYLKEDGTFDYRTSESSFHFDKNSNIDSLLQSYKLWTDINYSGSYWRALDAIEEENQFIREYTDMIKVAGPISPKLLTRKILTSNLDYSDYFLKRIILTEFVY